MSDDKDLPRYLPMPDTRRNSYLYYFTHDESAYTQQDKALRTLILKKRAESGIDAQLLETPHSWFSEDDKAFRTLNENSWVYSLQHTPEQIITRDDFYAGQQGERLARWPTLLSSSKITGDYLLLRNRDLATEHLNQPLNYALLDLMRMLKALALSDDGHYVNKQIGLLSRYIRQIEMAMDANTGSDRLFLAHFRESTLSEIHNEIDNQLQSSILRDRVERIQQQLNHIGELRHTLLHFSLTATNANPHPYWEKFATLEASSHDLSAFPTRSAQHCAKSTASGSTLFNPQNEPALLWLNPITLENLQECLEFRFISLASLEAREAYVAALQDLQRLIHFQGILSQLSELINRAGEVITLREFRLPIEQLFEQISLFIESSKPQLTQILHENTNIYYRMVQKKLEMTLWDKLFTTLPYEIDTFLKNQDDLARYPITEYKLEEAYAKLLIQIQKTADYLSLTSSEQRPVSLTPSTQWLLYDFLNDSGLQPFITQNQEQLTVNNNNVDFEACENKVPMSFLRSGYTDHGFFADNTPTLSADNRPAFTPMPNAGFFILLPFGVMGALWIYNKFSYYFGKNQEKPAHEVKNFI